MLLLIAVEELARNSIFDRKLGNSRVLLGDHLPALLADWRRNQHTTWIRLSTPRDKNDFSTNVP